MKTKVIRSHRRSMSLQVLADETVVVKVPLLVPQFLIDKFLKDNTEWIERQKLKLSHKKIDKKEYKEGEIFLFLGKEYKLRIGNYPQILFQGSNLLFPQFLVFRIQKEITNLVINEAKRIITEQVEHFAKEMGMSYKSISFSDTKSKWGSCTHDNRLQFSWRLVMAPILVLNYVVIHELAHTKEKNHSRSFWNKVRLYNPSYKQQIKWLKTNGHLLFT